MSTGSRPRMSSICTSRTWRTAVAPLCSSSKTVGSVRTGMPRSRQQRTTFARSVPGADGIAIVTSSGSTSSRIRPSSCVVPSTRTPSIRSRRLSGSSSTKPTGLRRSSGLRRISRRTRRPPSPAPTISSPRASLLGAKAAQRALVDRARDEARAADEGQHEQQVQREHAGRRVTVVSPKPARARHRLDERDVQQQRERGDDDGLDDRAVVALRDVAPPLPVQAEGGEDRDRADDDGDERRVEELLVARRHARGAVEAQPVGQPVRERDQHPVDRDLGQRMAVQGNRRRTDPSAHRVRLYGARRPTRHGVPSAARGRAHQQRRQQRRIAPHPLRAGAPCAGGALGQHDVLRAVEHPQAALGDEPLVDGARGGPGTSSTPACRARPPRGSSSRRRRRRGRRRRSATGRRSPARARRSRCRAARRAAAGVRGRTTVCVPRRRSSIAPRTSFSKR